MWIDPIKLTKPNKLITEYRTNGPVMKKFDYQPYASETYQQRVADLNERVFDREGLTSVLYKLNQMWDAPKSTFDNIQRLKDQNSVVVIGGQQAGLLTGPLYTIHKVISIINLAKKQEQQLGIPVIPVFWIAGEDHDFAEINHIKLKDTYGMKKYNISQQVSEKVQVSELQLDQEMARKWLHQVFEQLDETTYTNELYENLQETIKDSSTYVDFFAKIIFRLFENDGLVLIDSANKLVRDLESKHFTSLIKKQPEISEGVYQTTQQMKNQGYNISLDVEEVDAHLFYHKNGERVLLNKVGDKWVGKQNQCEFTTEQLLQIAEEQPYLLSNNVVTRPVMQELLFPTLAFLGGLAEVGYWSVLKPAFQALHIKMPPVLPRLSFTLVDRSVEKLIQRYGLQIDSVLNQGVDYERGNWLAAQSNPPIKEVDAQVKYAVERAHRPLKELAQTLGTDLGELADKNLTYLFQDIDFLSDRLVNAVKEKHKKNVEDFNLIETELYPEGGLQERSWNVIPFINQYGSNWIDQLVSQTYEYNTDHYVIYL
ncbi:bacillithiol biosynthesis cysteine-adding enzyme BshC [Aquibacillus sediminis]|uniref:bacillithiol biosynthesis cysteine-adding enzyme BshC n=1 Tax=Aquibacillus sediminis TaxID=2574734 RepID=UPI00110938DF|nr:bacillithiol biosynthesis cysteine-adding enzyme BshC [Aquibacillus sediminis]